MRRLRRAGRLGALAVCALVAVGGLTATTASASTTGVDTDGDGQLDDFDGDGAPDDADGDCIPDDADGNGVPDAATPPANCSPGEGGTLPESLSLQQISVLLTDVYLSVPDVTDGDEPDTYPNIPRLVENGVDAGPDWTVLDRLIGEPGVRDLLQEPDNRINEILLEEEDINNVEFVDPQTGGQVFVATDEARAHTLTQINAARGDQGLIGGSGSALRGPCMGMAWSYDSDGQPLDVAWDWDLDGPPVGLAADGSVEQKFTSGNPFKVDVDGAVIYTGVAGGLAPGSGPIDHDWFIQIKFLGFAATNVDNGGDPNSNGENRNLGAVNFNEDLPAAAKVSGLVSANAQMDAPFSGAEGSTQRNPNPFFCIGSGFVEFEGGLPLSAPGVALLFLSTVGLLFNARPARTWGGV
jgi:hypothetical protein